MGVLLQNDQPVGGISADVIESINFADFTTTSKTLPGAINELVDKTDDTNTIVGDGQQTVGTDLTDAVTQLKSDLVQLITKNTSRSGTISEAISGGSSKSITFAIETIQGYTPLGVLGLSKSGTNHDNVTISAFYISGGNVVVRLHNNSSSSITITALAADILHVKTFN